MVKRHKLRRPPRRSRAIRAIVVTVAAVGVGVGAWVASSSIRGGPTTRAASSGTVSPSKASGTSSKFASPPDAPVPPRSSAATFDGPAGVEATWVINENRRPGTAAWKITGNPPGVIAGFANRVSAQPGDTVTLYVTTNAASFRVEAYRMGYYGGAGARLVWTSVPTPGTTQPVCPRSPATNMVACDNWSPSLRFPVTASFVPGDYLVKLVGASGQASYIPITVADFASHATYLLENDIYTWQAWNPFGGYDFYAGLGSCPPNIYPPCNRARVDSFDRPYGYGQGAADFLGNEYPLVRFAEAHGLDVTYATSADIDQYPGFLLQHHALLSLGHDECWSFGERQAAQNAVAHGVNVVFFGASPVLRHVRLQASPLGPNREEVDYRDSGQDPLDGRISPLQVTGNTWSSPPTSWSEVPFVGENYTGFVEPGDPAVPFVVSQASGWLYQGTGLHDGSEIPGLLVSDFDQFDPGLSPANLQIFSHSPMPRAEVQTNVSFPASDSTYYTDRTSDAGVFDTGTVAWIPDLMSSAPLNQMTANLLVLFGQGPAGRSQPSVPNWRQLYP